MINIVFQKQVAFGNRPMQKLVLGHERIVDGRKKAEAGSNKAI